MASGDRIELLTADAFSSAMSTVAKESTVQTCTAKVDNVDADIAALAATVNNINSVNTADYQLDQTIHNVLADLYNNRIGVTNNTGGTAVAGTVMAKLNTLINSVNSIQASTNNSLHSTVFVPSDNLLKTVLNTSVNTTGGNYYPILGVFIAKYSGCIRIKINASITGNSAYIRICRNLKGANVPLYPGMPIQSVSIGDFGDKYAQQIFSASTNTYTMHMEVDAGDILYFVATSGTVTYTHISVYGSVISYY